MSKLGITLATPLLLTAMAMNANAGNDHGRPERPTPVPDQTGDVTQTSNLSADQQVYVRDGDTFIKDGNTYVPVTLNSDTDISLTPTTNVDAGDTNTFVPVTVQSDDDITFNPVTTINSDDDIIIKDDSRVDQTVDQHVDSSGQRTDVNSSGQKNTQSTTYNNRVEYPASSAIAHAANVYQAGQCNQADSGAAAAQGQSFGLSISFGGAEVNGIPVQYEDVLKDENGDAILDSEGNEQIVKKPLIPFMYFHEETTNEQRAKMDAAVPKKYQDTWHCGLNDTAGVILQMESTEKVTLMQVEGNKAVASIYADAQRDVANTQKAAQLESIDRQTKGTIMIEAFRHELNEQPHNPAGNRDHEHVVETVVNYGLQTMFKLEGQPIVAPQGSSYTRFNPPVTDQPKVIEPQ